tara:strand:- start:69752 stop:71815 length:2064 start_codon:yes stop_codon:yes gene_type:complete
MPSPLDKLKIALDAMVNDPTSGVTPHIFQATLASTIVSIRKEDGLGISATQELLYDYLQSFEVAKPKNASFLQILETAAKHYRVGAFPPNSFDEYDMLISVASESLKGERDTRHDELDELEDAVLITRGIGYKSAGFTQESRTWHRSYRQGSTEASYSTAAAKKAIQDYNRLYSPEPPFNLGKYYAGKYAKDTNFQELLNRACTEIADDFSFLRNESLAIFLNIPEGVTKKIIEEGGHETVIETKAEEITVQPIHFLQDIYTNDMLFFLELVNHDKRIVYRERYEREGNKFLEGNSLIRNGVLAKQNPEAVMELINLLDGLPQNFHTMAAAEKEAHLAAAESKRLGISINEPHDIDYSDNPFTSTGYTPHAATDYSLENKTYGTNHLREHFPNYNADLVPQHAFMGKFYAIIIPKVTYDSLVLTSAMNVVDMHQNQNKLLIHESIIDENEMTFVGGCPTDSSAGVKVLNKVSVYPNLSKPWEDLHQDEIEDIVEKFGMGKKQYTTLRTKLLPIMSSEEKNPSYLREAFIQAYLKERNQKHTAAKEPLETKDDILELIKNGSITAKTLVEELIEEDGAKQSLLGLQSEQEIQSATSSEAIKLFIEFKTQKKAVKKLFTQAGLYENTRFRFEREAATVAEQSNLRIINLTDEKLMQGITPSPTLTDTKTGKQERVINEARLRPHRGRPQ